MQGESGPYRHFKETDVENEGVSAGPRVLTAHAAGTLALAQRWAAPARKQPIALWMEQRLPFSRRESLF